MTIDIRNVASALHEIYTVAILKGDEEPPASAAIHEALEKQFPGITQAHINDAGCLITVRGYVEKGEPLPKEVIARMSSKQIDMMQAIFGEAAVRHVDPAQELLEDFMARRSAARKH